MIQEDKELLLKDICSRIPYGVKCQCFDEKTIATLTGVKSKSNLYFDELDWKEFDGIVKIDYCKPYLFPMSSMTEWQERELEILMKNSIESCGMLTPYDCLEMERFFNENHLDWRGLIPKGLANDATNLGIY